MSYNPHVHGSESRRPSRQRRLDPKAGKHHSDILRSHTPRNINITDFNSRIITKYGWRIDYYKGDDFEMFYELIGSKNGTGVLKNEKKDKCIRVLSGSLFITANGEINQLLTNQAFVIPKGMEYELATSASDVELLVCQGSHYDETLETLTASTSVIPTAEMNTPDIRDRDPKVQEKAKRIAEKLQSQRKSKKAAQTEMVTNELGEKVPPPANKRTPLAGQMVVGVNPQPVGAGGYKD